MKDKLLIIGAGFIGTRVHEGLGGILSRRRIRSVEDAEEVIRHVRPRILINCAGYVGERNVDDCERHPAKTLSANAILPLLLAEASRRRKVKFVHVSTGCIYHYDYRSGEPLSEEKEPDFFDLLYSRAKIYAEAALASLVDRMQLLIVRPRVPLDDRPHPRNILTKLIAYHRAVDIPNSLTYLPDFIEALRHLLASDASGIFNVVNRGVLRYPELLKAYQRLVPFFRYETLRPGDLKLVRTNLLLSTKKLERSGFVPRDIHDAVNECVSRYVAYERGGRNKNAA
jgi:dTDP-4-dehydrorhamnose reductase